MRPVTLALKSFPSLTLTSAELVHRLSFQRDVIAPRLDRLMGYYRNPLSDLIGYLPISRQATLSCRPYRQYQEIGLPTRITGFRHTSDGRPVPAGPIDGQRKEVVIENDIAWRVNTLIDFALSQMPVITSSSPDHSRRAEITELLNAVLDGSGGIALLQQVTLLSAIHGSAYLLMQPSHELLLAVVNRNTPDGILQREPGLQADKNLASGGSSGGEAGGAEGQAGAEKPGLARSDIASSERNAATRRNILRAWAGALRLMTVEATRVLPLTCSLPASDPASVSWVQGHASDGGSAPPPPAIETISSYATAPSLRLAHAAILHPASLSPLANETTPGSPGSMFRRVTRFFTGIFPAPADEASNGMSFDLWSGSHWQRYIQGTLADEGDNPLGFVPLIPLINQYNPPGPDDPCPQPGLSEVEPLLCLQDELNTRLSDRANRVTLQSFRMYLAKNVEDFLSRPIGPGQMWASDNPDATIESFGGDASSPSEDSHISEVREALDKISGVPPVAAGLLEARIGNLTSAVALKVTLIALLSRTDKRRTALTQNLSLLCRRILEVFNAAGILETSDAERTIDITWASAIPENVSDQLAEAKQKLDLGISRATVLRELGYAEEIS